MEQSFRIDNILPDLRAAMNNQSCYFENRKPAEMSGGFLENKPLLTPESPEEDDKKSAESPKEVNCRKRSKHK